MIIKSMSRKQPSFEQLYDYIVRDNDNDIRYNFTHNCFGQDREAILNEFLDNAELLARRKGGNYMYHEIVSVSRSKQLSEEQQKAILRDIVQNYIRSRANDCLVFAGLHDEKDNQLHYHLIISANKVNEKKRYRLSRKVFDEVKTHTELYTLERYPELEQAKLISQDKSERSVNKKEGELKRRTKKPSQKDYMRSTLADIFSMAQTSQEYIDLLKAAKIESYVRGKTIGFYIQGEKRKYRLNTLGLGEEFDEMNYRFTETQQEHEKQQPQESQSDEAQESTADEFYSERDAIIKRKREEFREKLKDLRSNEKDNSRGRK